MADLKITALFVMSVATLLVFQGPQNTQALSYLDAYRNEVVAPDYNPYAYKYGSSGDLDKRTLKNMVARVMKKRRPEKESMRELYNQIVEKYPFLSKQGLNPNSMNLDDLLALTVFGQPVRN